MAESQPRNQQGTYTTYQNYLTTGSPFSKFSIAELETIEEPKYCDLTEEYLDMFNRVNNITQTHNYSAMENHF